MFYKHDAAVLQKPSKRITSQEEKTPRTSTNRKVAADTRFTDRARPIYSGEREQVERGDAPLSSPPPIIMDLLLLHSSLVADSILPLAPPPISTPWRRGQSAGGAVCFLLGPVLGDLQAADLPPQVVDPRLALGGGSCNSILRKPLRVVHGTSLPDPDRPVLGTGGVGLAAGGEAHAVHRPVVTLVAGWRRTQRSSINQDGRFRRDPLPREEKSSGRGGGGVLTDLFASVEVKHMDPHIFSAGDELVAEHRLQRGRLHGAGHVVALHQPKTAGNRRRRRQSEQDEVVNGLPPERKRITHWFASQNFTVEPSAVVMYRPSWLTSALVTGDLVSRVRMIFPLLTSHNLFVHYSSRTRKEN